MFEKKVILHSAVNLSKGNVCWIVVGKPEGKGPLGRYVHKLEDNIKKDNEEIEQESVEWNYLVQDMVKLQAVVDTVMNLQDP